MNMNNNQVNKGGNNNYLNQMNNNQKNISSFSPDNINHNNSEYGIDSSPAFASK
jgi:hypothetical protein